MFKGISAFLFLALVLTSGLAAANTRVVVRSSVDSQDPFEVVYASSDQTLAIEPGIYALVRGKDEAQLIYPGTVLDVGRAFNGMVAQFPMGAITGAYESMAVVNQRLVIFNKKTSLKDSDSYIEIGKTEPLIDAMTGVKVPLQPITSTDTSYLNVQVFQNSRSADSELLLVSVKQPNILGTGITFAAVLKRGNGSKIQFVGDPVVIDYNFLSAPDLKKLSVGGTFILSRNHLLALSKSQGHDDRIIRKFRENVSNLLSQMRPGKMPAKGLLVDPTGRNPFSPPLYDVAARELMLENVPIEKIGDQYFSIFQRIDPLTSSATVFLADVQNPSEPNTATAIPGRVDYDSKSHRYKILDLSRYNKFHPDASDAVVLASIDDQTYLIFRSAYNAKLVSVNISSLGIPSFDSVERMVGIKVHKAEGTDSYSHAVILSWELKNRTKGTYAVKLLENNDYIKALDVVTLQTGFSTLGDLAGRIKKAPVLGNDRILFDNVSTQASIRAATQGTTKPYIDVLASGHSKIKQVYLTALRSIKIGGNELRWDYFDPTGAHTNMTGFYQFDPPQYDGSGVLSEVSHPKAFVQGTILTEDDQKPVKGKKKLEIDYTSAKTEPIKFDFPVDLDRKELPKFQFQFTPYSSVEDKKAGRVGFNLAIFGRESALKPGTTHVSSLLTTLSLGFDFTRFQGVRLVQGRRRGTSKLILLVFAGPKDEASQSAHPSRGGPGIWVVPYELSIRPEGLNSSMVLTTNTKEQAWLHQGQLSPIAVKDRIKFDAEGTPLWAMTPDLEISDRNYGLRSLVTPVAGKLLLPNQGALNSPVRFDEVLGDDWDFAFGNESRWIVDSKPQLEARFSGLSKYLEDQKKRQEEAAKSNKRAKKREEVLFPDLNGYLDAQANPATKREHTVLLVDPDLYAGFRNLMLARLLDNDKENLWRIYGDDFRIHAYDPSFTPEETLGNLQKLGRAASKRDLLFVDLDTLYNTELHEPARSIDMSHEPIELEGMDQTESEKEEGEQKEEGSTSTAGDAALHHDPMIPSLLAQSPPDSLLTKIVAEEPSPESLQFPYSRLAFLALEGDTVSLRKFADKPNSHRFPLLMLATPTQWRSIQELYPDEKAAGVFDRYKVDARFLTASWTVWSPKSSKALPATVEFNRNPISRDEYQVFQNLERLLTDLSDPQAEPKHHMLVVPEEMKTLITRLIMTRWATDNKDLAGQWNYKNRDLALFQVNLTTDQNAIADNYESMRGSLASRRPVLLAEMSDLLKISRPTAAEKAFKLKDPVAMERKAGDLLANVPGADLSSDDPENIDAIENSQMPHMMWWLTTEGRRIQPKKNRDWDIRSEAKPQIPTLIITTEKELEDMDQETAFEQRFVNFRQQFEMINLAKPTDEIKRQLLEDLLRRPEIASLQYQFKHEDYSSEEARRQLIGLMIGKVEQISSRLKIESTYAFLKIYVTFKKALTEDFELRRHRMVDSSYLFRLFARVFPLPLSYEILHPEDPLLKLRDNEKAARGLQEAGYEGALELKTRVVRDLTSHTRGGTDAGRKIPSSLVLIGEPGSGKTYMIETLIRYLNMKPYDFNKPHDEEVDAFIIRVQDIVDEDDPAHPEKLSVGKVLRHLENFLSMPRGWRGLILFDDLHKAGSTNILKQLMTFMQTMFEAPNGLIKVRRMGPANAPTTGEIKEIPVRNLQLTVTLNPTRDKQKRARFIEKFDKKDPVLEAVAAITRDDYQIEDSIFSRFADVVDMTEFPREAKVPSLLNKMREANMQEFSAHPRVVAVTPQTLDILVNAFPNSNARDFLTPATYSLLGLPNELAKAPIYIIDPQPLVTGNGAPKSPRESGFWVDDTTKVEPGKIEDQLRRSTVVHAIRTDDPESKLIFLSFLLNNFRGLVYNGIILGSQNIPEISGDYQSRVTMMFSFLTALIGNLSDYPSMPLVNVAIKPVDFGLNDLDSIRDLQNDINKHSRGVKRASISIPNFQNLEERVDLNSFLGLDAPLMPERNRMDLLTETSRSLIEVLEPLMAQTLQSSTIASLTEPAAWAAGLSEKEPKEEYKRASEKIMRIYLDFSRKLYDVNLAEMRDRGSIQQMQIYDEARLFLLCLDNALTQLPWSYVTEFILRALDRATTDLALGQKTGLQHFLFKSAYSPLSTVTPESILSNARSISIMRTADSTNTQNWHEYFTNNCESFLIGKGGNQ